MKLNLKLIASPFSINKAHYKRTKTRTQACREWGDGILHQLMKYRKDLAKFHEFVKKKINDIALEIEITHFIHHKNFYTKEGKISFTSNDISNIEKMLIDLIYDSRFYKRGAINLNLNDALNVTMLSKKRPCEGEEFIIINISTRSNKFGKTPQHSDFS